MKRKSHHLYNCLIASYNFACFAEGILLPIYAIYVQKIGGDILDASWAIAIFSITSWFGTILLHRLNRSAKHKSWLLIGGRLVRLIGIISYLAVSNIIMLFVTQVLIALGNAMANPVFDEELEENRESANKVYKRWLYEWSQDIVNGVAAIVGGLVVTSLGFRFMIIVMIITASVSFAGILYYQHNKHKHIRLQDTENL